MNKQINKIIDESEASVNDDTYGPLFNKDTLTDAVQDAFILGRNAALDWASENAKAQEDWYRGRRQEPFVNKYSILSGKTSKDLDI